MCLISNEYIPPTTAVINKIINKSFRLILNSKAIKETIMPKIRKTFIFILSAISISPKNKLKINNIEQVASKINLNGLLI